MENTKDYLSLGWFKETVEKTIEKVVKENIANASKGINGIEVVTTPVKIYKQAKLIGDALTVVFLDGSIICKLEATVDHWNAVRSATTMEAVIDIMSTESVKKERAAEEKIIKRNKAINEGLQLLVNTGDFKIKGKNVFLKGTSRTIPPLLVEKFAEVVGEYADCSKSELITGLRANDEYQALKRFFMWCCLNPRAEVANDLYEFLGRNSFRITKQGFFVALRNVVTVGGADKSLLEMVSNSYNKVKAVWKKDPKAFNVYRNEIDNSYFISAYKTLNAASESTNLGNLSELYLDLPNMSENRYTDAHTRTFDIRVGQVVNMPMEDCNWSTADCAHAGLHFTSDQINYVGCGDTSVLIIINPMKVVGIGEYKGRCYEYLPIMTVPRAEVTDILHDGDFDTMQLDEIYAMSELEDLAVRAADGFTLETTKHEFNLPSISMKEINKIVLSLSEMKASLTSRINILG
jgi:hypothetical protein